MKVQVGRCAQLAAANLLRRFDIEDVHAEKDPTSPN